MKKILTVLAVVLTFVAFNANAKTLEERIANVILIGNEEKILENADSFEKLVKFS